jgi:hypothetical protein
MWVVSEFYINLYFGSCDSKLFFQFVMMPNVVKIPRIKQANINSKKFLPLLLTIHYLNVKGESVVCNVYIYVATM